MDERMATFILAANAPDAPAWFKFKDPLPAPVIPHHNQFKETDPAMYAELESYLQEFGDLNHDDLSDGAVDFLKDQDHAEKAHIRWQDGQPERRYWAWKDYYLRTMYDLAHSISLA